MSTGYEYRLDLPDEAATRRLGQDLALALAPGDTVALFGDLGAGKTTLARSAIRALAKDTKLEVPSPTFTLVQTYDLPGTPIAHFDLYRLSSPDELIDIGYEELLQDHAILVEWPERALDALPVDRLEVRIAIDDAADQRSMTLQAPKGGLAERMRRSLQIRSFLTTNWTADCDRRRIAGDASVRRYERIGDGGQTRILMDAEEIPNGPPVTPDGLSYTDVAHITRSVHGFVAIAAALKEHGHPSPIVFAQDVDFGVLLLEDFGSETILVDGKPVFERYQAAIERLAHLHRSPPNRKLPLAGGGTHILSDYDAAALEIEMEQLVDWYAPEALGEPLTKTASDAFRACWAKLLDRLLSSEPGWVLRDFHSPNLMWLDPPRKGSRIGLIDFQDAMIGPTAYDLASLVQDARVDIPQKMETDLVDHYLALRGSDFNADHCREAVSIASAQRNCKILGAFTRLAVRDGKPDYLKHRPRIAGYLTRTLSHPVLADLKNWFDKYLPLDCAHDHAQ